MEYALITGASSGIGAELARVFAQNKINLILVARSEDKLKELAAELSVKGSIDVQVIVKDLSIPNAADELYSEIQTKKLEVKYLVNNAGFGLNGDFDQSDIKKDEEMINLNILTLTKLTRLFLPDFLAKNSGKILNVASIAGMVPGPNMPVYHATKAYVLSFTQSLAIKYSHTKVTFTALCPGYTRTNFFKVAHFDRRLKSSIKLSGASANDVAEFGYKSMLAGKWVVIYGITNRLAVSFTRLLPKRIVGELIKKVT